ncbi:Carboxylic ester hydrolase [Mycena venus]|uniref:Carboxylic ester hydrolase n=1 Tax=Mycena venus TaxID=2733690 RepID=A0A8H6XIA3_9AGAR|nr:Carboxylic ester hydrolase [Mycena venus]
MRVGFSLFGASIGATYASASAIPTVHLGRTAVIGSALPLLKQEFFGGIPYAEPPVGELRFRPPVPKKALNVPNLNATEFGPGCLQPPPGAPSSEDCLTINVFRPAGLGAHQKLPVMAWIYGGGFISERMLSTKTNSSHSSGFRENIAAFGGDSEKVTIFGESAGAKSLAIHLLNPKVSSLARAVILESGFASSGLATFPASHGQNNWDNFVRAVPRCQETVGSVKALDCLRNASSGDLQNAIGVATVQSNAIFTWGPVIDGPGGTIFTPIATNSSEMIKADIIANYSLDNTKALGKAADELLRLYPDIPALGSPFGTGNQTFGLNSNFKRLAAITGDILLQSQRRTWFDVASKAKVKMFGYLLTDSPPSVFPAYEGGVIPHALDLYYLFGWLPSVNGTAAAEGLSVQMMDYWISFATSLDPNDGRGATRPLWPEFTQTQKNLLELNSANMTVIPDNYRAEQIGFINDNLELFRH